MHIAFAVCVYSVIVSVMLFDVCLAEHNQLTNTLKKKAKSLRSRIVRGPSYTGDKPAAARSPLLIRTASFSDTNSKGTPPKKTVSSVSKYLFTSVDVSNKLSTDNNVCNNMSFIHVLING